MTEIQALALLRKKDPSGLAYFIDQYGAYVGAIVRNVLGDRVPMQDAEEVASDVFLVLWQNAEKPRTGHVKAYLGSIARSRAVNRLRGQGWELSIDEDILTLPAEGPEVVLEQKEQRRLTREAVRAMPMPDREIFVRYYYYCESAMAIAGAMHMTPAAVRQRLKRGRDRLREVLTKGDVI